LSERPSNPQRWYISTRCCSVHSASSCLNFFILSTSKTYKGCSISLLLRCWLVLFNITDHLARQLAGSRGTGGHRDALFSLQPRGVQLRKVLDTYSRDTCQFFRYLYETVGIVAARIADDNRQIRSPGLYCDRLLAR